MTVAETGGGRPLNQPPSPTLPNDGSGSTEGRSTLSTKLACKPRAMFIWAPPVIGSTGHT